MVRLSTWSESYMNFLKSLPPSKILLHLTDSDVELFERSAASEYVFICGCESLRDEWHASR